MHVYVLHSTLLVYHKHNSKSIPFWQTLKTGAHILPLIKWCFSFKSNRSFIMVKLYTLSSQNIWSHDNCNDWSCFSYCYVHQGLHSSMYNISESINLHTSIVSYMLHYYSISYMNSWVYVLNIHIHISLALVFSHDQKYSLILLFWHYLIIY